jgi:hypothetical protein
MLIVCWAMPWALKSFEAAAVVLAAFAFAFAAAAAVDLGGPSSKLVLTMISLSCCQIIGSLIINRQIVIELRPMRYTNSFEVPSWTPYHDGTAWDITSNAFKQPEANASS